MLKLKDKDILVIVFLKGFWFLVLFQLTPPGS